MKRFRLLIVLAVVSLTVGSCKRSTITYYTTGITLINYDNAGPFIHEASGSSVSDSSYVIRINYTSDQTAYYAVNDDNTYAPGNKPTSISVTCLSNFDSLHPAGSILNDYFINGAGIGSTTEDVVNNFLITKDFYPTHEPDDLWLMTPPAAPGFYRFVIEMRFDDGVIARDTTSAIAFVP